MDQASNQALQAIANQNARGTSPQNGGPNLIGSTTKSGLNIELWLRGVLTKLRHLRGIETPRDQYAAFLAWLTQRGFTNDDARKAELWLFEGDWSTRGTSPRLESSDFTPSEKQWRTRDNLIVRTPEEYARERRDMYQQGRQDERAERIAEAQWEQSASPLSEQTKEHLAAIKRTADLEDEVLDLKRRLADMEGVDGNVLDWKYRYDIEQQKRIAAEGTVRDLRAYIEGRHKAQQRKQA